MTNQELLYTSIQAAFRTARSHAADITQNEPPQDLDKLILYAELLSRWTRRVDLVSNPKVSDIITRHIVDCAVFSMILAEVLPRAQQALDIGSGGGLPGIVLAAISPHLHVTLCEPREKRVVFLKEARRVLGLQNVSVTQARLEDLPPELLASHDIFTMRAVGGEGRIAAVIAAKTHAPQGILAGMVGPNWNAPEEGVDLSQLIDFIRYDLGNSLGHRAIVLMKCFT
jgi:16S rRNA (guanine(527)-N(7))-methyltransferase RsmG